MIEDRLTSQPDGVDRNLAGRHIGGKHCCVTVDKFSMGLGKAAATRCRPKMCPAHMAFFKVLHGICRLFQGPWCSCFARRGIIH
jgi:hypothetical protein